MPKLGVNIDHIATLRQARKEFSPDPIKAALICQKAGADAVVCHLREDRRHIQDDDIKKLRMVIKDNLTLELSLNKDIIKIASVIKPDTAVFVPEKRQEVTTEGGLNVEKNYKAVLKAVDFLGKKKIAVSLFIDPSKKQILSAQKSGARFIEIHTGVYANAKNAAQKKKELEKIREMALFAQSLGLIVNAGHGLKYHDVKPIAQIKGIHELNIGHSIISEAVFIGLYQAVKNMKKIVS